MSRTTAKRRLHRLYFTLQMIFVAGLYFFSSAVAQNTYNVGWSERIGYLADDDWQPIFPEPSQLRAFYPEKKSYQTGASRNRIETPYAAAATVVQPQNVLVQTPQPQNILAEPPPNVLGALNTFGFESSKHRNQIFRENYPLLEQPSNVRHQILLPQHQIINNQHRPQPHLFDNQQLLYNNQPDNHYNSGRFLSGHHASNLHNKQQLVVPVPARTITTTVQIYPPNAQSDYRSNPYYPSRNAEYEETTKKGKATSQQSFYFDQDIPALHGFHQAEGSAAHKSTTEHRYFDNFNDEKPQNRKKLADNSRKMPIPDFNPGKQVYEQLSQYGKPFAHPQVREPNGYFKTESEPAPQFASETFYGNSNAFHNLNAKPFKEKKRPVVQPPQERIVVTPILNNADLESFNVNYNSRPFLHEQGQKNKLEEQRLKTNNNQLFYKNEYRVKDELQEINEDAPYEITRRPVALQPQKENYKFEKPYFPSTITTLGIPPPTKINAELTSANKDKRVNSNKPFRINYEEEITKKYSKSPFLPTPTQNSISSDDNLFIREKPVREHVVNIPHYSTVSPVPTFQPYEVTSQASELDNNYPNEGNTGQIQNLVPQKIKIYSTVAQQIDPQTIRAHPFDSQTIGPQPFDSQTIGPQPFDSQTIGAQPVDSQTNSNHRPSGSQQIDANFLNTQTYDYSHSFGTQSPSLETQQNTISEATSTQESIPVPPKRLRKKKPHKTTEKPQEEENYPIISTTSETYKTSDNEKPAIYQKRKKLYRTKTTPSTVEGGNVENAHRKPVRKYNNLDSNPEANTPKINLENSNRDDSNRDDMKFENYPSTTTSTSATSEQTSESSSPRPRFKPRYGNSTRPRFSIKELKSTTTEKTDTTERIEIRKNNVSKSRNTTTNVDTEHGEVEIKKFRPRIRPLRPRSSTTTISPSSGTSSHPTSTEKINSFKPSGISRPKGPNRFNRYSTSTASPSDMDQSQSASVQHSVRLNSLFSAKRTSPLLRSKLTSHKSDETSVEDSVTSETKTESENYPSETKLYKTTTLTPLETTINNESTVEQNHSYSQATTPVKYSAKKNNHSKERPISKSDNLADETIISSAEERNLGESSSKSPPSSLDSLENLFSNEESASPTEESSFDHFDRSLSATISAPDNIVESPVSARQRVKANFLSTTDDATLPIEAFFKSWSNSEESV